MSYAGSANAYTPSVSADCSGVTISGAGYDAGRDNTWTATVGGDTRSGTFGASFSESFPVPQDGATTSFSFRIVGWDGNYDSGVRSGSVGPCGQLPDDTEVTKVTYCHATGSAGNPYVEITTSVNAFYNAGHIDHGDDIWAAFSFVKQGESISVPAQGDQSLLASGCAARDLTPDPTPDPVDEPGFQCGDGTSPGDLDGDGDNDAADCTVVLDDTDGVDESTDTLDTDPADTGPAGSTDPDGTVDTDVVEGVDGRRAVLVPNVVDAGLGDVAPAVTVLSTTGRPFRGGPLLLGAGGLLLAVAALRPARHDA